MNRLVIHAFGAWPAELLSQLQSNLGDFGFTPVFSALTQLDFGAPIFPRITTVLGDIARSNEVIVADIILIRLPPLPTQLDSEEKTLAQKAQQRLIRLAEQIVYAHGAWSYLPIVVIGFPSDENQVKRLKRAQVTQWIDHRNIDTEAHSIAVACRFAHNATWWSGENRGALPALVIHKPSGCIIRANDAARRLLGTTSLVGEPYHQAAEARTSLGNLESTDVKVASQSRLSVDHPIAIAISTNTPVVTDHKLTRTVHGGSKEEFTVTLVCHPVPIPGVYDSIQDSGGDCNRRCPEAAVVWMLDQSGFDVVVRALRDLPYSQDEQELLTSIVTLATKLGFTRARLYRFDPTSSAMYGTAEVGYSHAFHTAFLSGRGKKLSALTSDPEFDPTTRTIVTAAASGEPLAPFLVITNAPNSAGDWELRGQICKTSQAPLFEKDLDKENVNRWIEAPIWIHQDEAGKLKSPLWGKLSLERGDHSDDITVHDLQHVRVFATVVGEHLRNWERRRAENRSLELLRTYSAAMEHALAGDPSQLFELSPRARRHFANGSNTRRDFSLPDTFDIVVASILDLFLGESNGEIALYREYDSSVEDGIRRLGPVLYANEGLSSELEVPPHFFSSKVAKKLFPFMTETTKPVSRNSTVTRDLDDCIAEYGDRFNENQLKYFAFVAAELQILVRQSPAPIGVICIVSSDGNAFRTVPPILEQFQPIASVWIDLASRQSARHWLLNSSWEVTSLLPLLNTCKLSNDLAWYAGLAALLTSRDGLQWNRAFIFDANSSLLPRAAKLVYAIGGLADDESAHKHSMLQASVGDHYSGNLYELVAHRITDIHPHFYPNGYNEIKDWLYEAMEQQRWELHFATAGDACSFSELIEPSVMPLGSTPAEEAAKNKYIRIDLAAEPAVLHSLNAFHNQLFKSSDELFVFPLKSGIGKTDGLMGWVVLNMRQPGAHRFEDMIEATSMFIRAASEFLAARRHRLYWKGWNRDAPRLFHDSRSIKQYIGAAKIWTESPERPAGVSPDCWTYVSRSVTLLERIYETPEPQSCYYHDVMRRLHADYDKPGTRRAVRVEYEKQDHAIEIPCDESTVLQILKELLSNSVDARGRAKMTNSVNVFIFISERQVSLPSGTIDIIEINYDDDGPGIPKEFEPYIFVDGFTYSDGEERGRGLSLLRSRVMAFGGDIRLDTPEDKSGVRFVISFRRG